MALGGPRRHALRPRRVPAGAALWVDGAETRAAGPVRRFATPTGLRPGATYHYTFRARWAEGGRTVNRSRTVVFRAGDDVAIDLTGADPPGGAAVRPDHRGGTL